MIYCTYSKHGMRLIANSTQPVSSTPGVNETTPGVDETTPGVDEASAPGSTHSHLHQVWMKRLALSVHLAQIEPSACQTWLYLSTSVSQVWYYVCTRFHVTIMNTCMNAMN